jgi:hypothetical protein
MIKRLLEFLTLAVGGGGEPVVTGRRNSLGYQQILTGALGVAVGLTMPTSTSQAVTGGGTTQAPAPGYAVIQNTGTASVRWRDDGIAPTATVGMVLAVGAELDYAGDIGRLQFIQTAAGAQLEITLYY